MEGAGRARLPSPTQKYFRGTIGAWNDVSDSFGLDGNFGERVLRLAEEMPVWIISSETNDLAVEQARTELEKTRASRPSLSATASR
jgi:hypothetical protein